MKELNESTVLITGASGGIGAACVQAFAEAGARVVLADVDESGREWADRPDADRIVQLRRSINVLGYTATPDQIASVVVFLASPAAGFITGALLPVSGGTECGYGVKY
jgi:NAD(P)-dependent dehydrogenase (short-subunit alcohol dehydrogenase family)